MQQMLQKKRESPKNIDSLHKIDNLQNQFHRQIRFSSLQKQEKKYMFRNRSLKQLFGNISSAEKLMRSSAVGCCNAKQKKQQMLRRQKIKQSLPHKKKKSNCYQDNEYFASGNTIKSKGNEIMRSNKQLGLNIINKISNLKINKQQNNHKDKQDYNKVISSLMYQPQAYNWRKSKSREKQNDLMGKKRVEAIQKIVQCEYYTTTNTTNAQISKKQNNTNRQYRNCKNRIRTSSSESKKELLLKPKVREDVFSPKSKKIKGVISPSKNMLFTFGI